MTAQEWMDYFNQHGFNATDLRQMMREMNARQDHIGYEWANGHMEDLVTVYNYRMENAR